MKSKILSIIVIGLFIIVALSIGYETHFKSDVLGISDLKINVYSGNKTLGSYAGQSIFSDIKGILFSWYTQPPGEVVDQSRTSNNGYQNIYGGYWRGQTFTVGVDGKLTRIKVYIRRYYSPGDLVAELHGVSGGMPNSTIYASVRIPQDDIPTSAAAWVNITFSNPVDVSAGEVYAIVLHVYNNGGSQLYLYSWYQYGSYSNVYSRGHMVLSSDGGSSWSCPDSSEYYDFDFVTYVDPGQQVSAFQINMDYSIAPQYTVAYKDDVGRSIDTFNYTINIYHNVDSNQSWILAYSTSYTNVTSISAASYSSPWISMLSGSYSTDYHDYYWRVEVVVNAFDTITGRTVNNSDYVILSDQFYWQSYMSFNPQVSIVDTNMMVQDVFQPYSIILAMMIILGYFIIRKRMMERD